MRKVLYILGQLNDEDVEWMTQVGERRDLEAGTLLIQEGVNSDHLYIVISGVLAVLTLGGTKEIAQLGVGEMLGEVSFVDSRPPSATIKVLSKSRVLAIPRAELKEKMLEDEGFGLRFYRALAVFLSYRLRDNTAMLGYGKPGQAAPATATNDELDDNIMDTLWLAGSRFERIMKRLNEG
jgi:CRP/FNR family transcriptional regulator, cyclic AMP receptor protein